MQKKELKRNPEWKFKIPSPIQSDHFVIIVRIVKNVVDVALSAASGDYGSTAVTIHGVIPIIQTWGGPLKKCSKSD